MYNHVLFVYLVRAFALNARAVRTPLVAPSLFGRFNGNLPENMIRNVC